MTPTLATEPSNRFLADILAQPAALHAVLDDVVAGQAVTLQKAAECLAEAPRVVLTSMGSAFHSMLPMADALELVHPNVTLIETGELLRRPGRAGDLHIVMSRSGESKEIAELARRLHNDARPLVAVTMTRDSTLAQNASIVVHDTAPFDSFICTKAYSSLSLIGLLIAARMAGPIDPLLVSALHSSFNWMEQSAEDLSSAIARIGWLGQPVTFLSRGAGRATASAGSLWIQEAARVRAAVTTIDEFLHGPVEQVEDGFAGVWIDLEPDALSRAQRLSLQDKGADLWGVVTAEPGSGDVVVPLAGLPAPFRTLPAALPLQLLAFAAGRARGLAPGNMRYMGWVVT